MVKQKCISECGLQIKLVKLAMNPTSIDSFIAAVNVQILILLRTINETPQGQIQNYRL